MVLSIGDGLIFYLTHKVSWPQEIQKIVVFEGAFEKIFSIIKEEGGSDGGVVVQVFLASFHFLSSAVNPALMSF